ncbi:MAG: transcription elongation factor GreA [Chloroflexi bacterium]|nr:transcription elongation factor GreA [Chloroflexota bacterium]MQC26049.1 transcription elongation factor GreA [Chloroflexota bacterium]
MANPKEYYLTAEGAEKLGLELENLKGPQRIELAKRLRTAIQQGDLSENADYSKAKEDQGFLEGRIQEIEVILGSAVIISDKGSADGLIALGSTITIKEEGRDPIQYFMVGAKEADPRNGKISNESPIGQALLGHRAGEKVNVTTPAGTIAFEIKDVK